MHNGSTPQTILDAPPLRVEVVSDQPYQNRAARRHHPKPHGGTWFIPRDKQMPALNEPYIKPI